jgi:hypothetical protein
VNFGDWASGSPAIELGSIQQSSVTSPAPPRLLVWNVSSESTSALPLPAETTQIVPEQQRGFWESRRPTLPEVAQRESVVAHLLGGLAG